MAIIKLSVPNPLDGTATFTSVQFAEADDSSGTGSSTIATESISSTYRSQIDPGFTTYTYTTGSTSKYYAARYYNTSTAATSDYTAWTLGGKDRWDTLFETAMDDSSNAVWSQAIILQFKKWALEALFPDLYRQVIDTSLTLDYDATPTYTYTVPYGIFHISEVGVGDTENSSSTFSIVHPDKWTLENSTLHFKSLSGLPDLGTIRLICHKKYLEVGEVPERFDHFVLYHMKMNAYLYLADDFPRFKQWAQLQEGTRVSFENLRVHAREFERKFIEGKAEVRELSYPTLI